MLIGSSTPRVHSPVRRTLLALVALVLALPASASAAPAPPPSIVIGPLQAAHGYQVVLSASCGPRPVGVITYVKGPARERSIVSYSAPVTCSATPRGVSLSATWPRVASITLTGRAGARTGPPTLPAGCHQRPGSARTATLAGALNLAPNALLGRLALRRVRASLTRGGTVACGAAVAPEQLLARFAPDTLLLASARPGHGEVYLSRGFRPSAGVSASAAVDVSSTRAVILTRTGLSVAGAGALIGRLTATEAPVCLGDRTAARNVDLAGTLTANLAVIGRVSISAAAARSATYGPSAAKLPSHCDGAGAKPITPKVDNECSSLGVCSISAGFSADTFYDTSDPGTQRVVSETIDFGDGTSGTFTRGQASHTYTRPGRYTATVRIRADSGQTYTATTPVDITA